MKILFHSFILFFITVTLITFSVCDLVSSSNNHNNKNHNHRILITDIWTEEPWDDIGAQWGKKAYDLCKKHPEHHLIKVSDSDKTFCRHFSDTFANFFLSNLVSLKENSLVNKEVDIEATSLTFPWKGYGLQAIVDITEQIIKHHIDFREGEIPSPDDSPLRGVPPNSKKIDLYVRGKVLPWMIRVGNKSGIGIPFPPNYDPKSDPTQQKNNPEKEETIL